jgi:hypothetical protein
MCPVAPVTSSMRPLRFVYRLTVLSGRNVNR